MARPKRDDGEPTEAAELPVDTVEIPEVAYPVEELQRALDEERNRNLRLRADFDNLRKRGLSEQEAARRAGHRAALVPMLPVLDALERALDAGSTDSVFYEGVASTLRLLEAALREAGAEPVESLGLPFDPRAHEAVDTTVAADVPAGTVVRELRRGWRRGDDLLRPAQVVVAGREDTPSETEN
jgi:molecular chaperone GrpE